MKEIMSGAKDRRSGVHRGMRAVFFVGLAAIHCTGNSVPLGSPTDATGPGFEGDGVVCPSVDAAAELEALQSLAESLSSKLFEGRRGDDGVIEIDRVLRGFGLWEGGRLLPSEDSREAFAAVGQERWRFAADGWVQHQGSGAWTARVRPIRPLADTASDLDAPWLGPDVRAVVAARLSRIEGNQLFFETTEVLRGEDIPSRFYALMLVRDHPLPVRPTSRWILAVRSFSFIDGQQVFLADWADIRGDTPEHRARALEVREGPDVGPELFAEAEDWTQRVWWRLAPYAVETTVSGLLHECNTGLGGMVEHHRIEVDLRGAGAAPGEVALGGHGYFSERACGDRTRIAIDGVGVEVPAGFSCPGGCTGPAYYPGTGVRAQALEGTPGYARAASDAVAPGPTLLGAQEDPPYPMRPDGPWSRSPSMTFTWAAADEIAEVTVDEVEVTDDGVRVGLAGSELQLFLPCPDPRFVEGAQLFLPTARLGTDQPSLVVPGSVLEGTTQRALGQFVLQGIRQLRSAMTP
ncbi:MAG: hypothetical protein AAFU79_07060 [Myxococcota bacterium]